MSTTSNAKKAPSLKDAIVDLYLNVKIRTSEEVVLAKYQYYVIDPEVHT